MSMKNNKNPDPEIIHKQIIFYIDEIPDSTKINCPTVCCLTHLQTKFALKRNMPDIHTTDLTECSFGLLDLGYKIFLRKRGKTLNLYPGMDTVGNKEIRKQHNLMKLVVGGYFDEDFIKN